MSDAKGQITLYVQVVLYFDEFNIVYCFVAAFVLCNINR